MLNVLYLYNATQTYTNTVYEHIACFDKYSKYRSFYCHHDLGSEFCLDLARFDAIAIHFSIRLPFDQLSASAVKALSAFKGLKFLFIQDEYDHTHRAWHWIKQLGIQLVFTVVPANGVERVYPSSEFKNTKFVSILTGYVPDNLLAKGDESTPSTRQLIVGYRGRPLPIKYGQLGIEKVKIGKVIKQYCTAQNIKCDIAWSEESRIYGPKWYEFMVSCRSMLGSESGSNVFDWDGSLNKVIAEYRTINPASTDTDIYEKLIRKIEIDGLMNQISPRVFEAIAAKTILVLFEGEYSGVIKPDEHFIPVKKDFSNLAEVFELLQCDAYVDAMAERAWKDVIASGKYTYRSLVALVDNEIVIALEGMKGDCSDESPIHPATGGEGLSSITTAPIRAKPPQLEMDTILHTVFGAHGLKDLAKRLAIYLWMKFPHVTRSVLKLQLKKTFG